MHSLKLPVGGATKDKSIPNDPKVKMSIFIVGIHTFTAWYKKKKAFFIARFYVHEKCHGGIRWIYFCLPHQEILYKATHLGNC